MQEMLFFLLKIPVMELKLWCNKTHQQCDAPYLIVLYGYWTQNSGAKLKICFYSNSIFMHKVWMYFAVDAVISYNSNERWDRRNDNRYRYTYIKCTESIILLVVIMSLTRLLIHFIISFIHSSLPTFLTYSVTFFYTAKN